MNATEMGSEFSGKAYSAFSSASPGSEAKWEFSEGIFLESRGYGLSSLLRVSGHPP